MGSPRILCRETSWFRRKFPSPAHGIISRSRRQPHRVLIILELFDRNRQRPVVCLAKTQCRADWTPASWPSEGQGALGETEGCGWWAGSLFLHPAPCTSRRLRSSRPDCCRGLTGVGYPKPLSPRRCPTRLTMSLKHETRTKKRGPGTGHGRWSTS
jgi:hypothetical protein